MASVLETHFSDQERLLINELRQTYADLLVEQKDTAHNFQILQENSVYKVVKTACWHLGFIDKDAELIAQVWSKKSSDLLHFDPQAWPNLLHDFPIKIMNNLPFLSCPKQLGLYVVAPDANWIKKLAPTAVDTLQLRFKSNDPHLIEQEVIAAIEYAKNESSRLFINDHWKLAIKHHAYGVHLGQEDLENADIQAIQKAGLRLGISSHGYVEMLRALSYQPSYIAMGAIFPTTLKAMETVPQGLGRLKKYSALLNEYSTVGIGGINENSIKDILATGVGSAAVVRAVTQAKNYVDAIQSLKSYFSSTI